MTFQDYQKELDKTGLMRYWKKPPPVQAVVAPGQTVNAGLGNVQEPKPL